MIFDLTKLEKIFQVNSVISHGGLHFLIWANYIDSYKVCRCLRTVPWKRAGEWRGNSTHA